MCSFANVSTTLYEILGVKEDATFDEVRSSYRSSILNHHPDKLQRAPEGSNPNHQPKDRFLQIQRAWEVLGNSKSRAAYDFELQALRQDAITSEDISLEDLTIEDAGDVAELYYPCRCGDCFAIDSLELKEMGYILMRDRNKVSLQTPNASPASVVLPCGSCSLKVRLSINADKICYSLERLY